MNRYHTLLSPAELKSQYPVSAQGRQNVLASRASIQNILNGKDPRFMMIVGPCSFHDAEANVEYAHRLKKLSQKVSEKIFIVMRVYLEKPRTALGWKGYLNDPDLNESFQIEKGVLGGRKFMLELAHLNIPIATEILNPLASLYWDDLISWASIGARTSESQIHREIASGLAMPVGFKNATSGNIKTAIYGILNARQAHTFMGINEAGALSVVHSRGNPDAHLVLRGSDQHPNYAENYLALAEQYFSELNIPSRIIIDCSHGNANGRGQQQVLKDVLAQKNQSVKGVMLESFLLGGQQALSTDLQYGRSITDSCLSWEETEEAVHWKYKNLTTALMFN